MPATEAATHPATVPFPSRIHAVQPPAEATDTLDDQIGQAIHRGVDYLLRHFKAGRLDSASGFRDDTGSGVQALAVYALLQAGEATNDDRLAPHAAGVEDMLRMLKAMPMDHGPATYARALRCAALAVYDRGEDKTALRADAAWLMKANMDGAYTYEAPTRNLNRRDNRWDNSNAQYGALGIWSAAEAGIDIPPSFWVQVESHWLDTQLPTGEWGYAHTSERGRLSMTVAGITTLLVAQDQLAGTRAIGELGRPPFVPALARGLKWLETADNSVTLPLEFKTYNLYGLERAALASGFKYFGTHDWYRELARNSLMAQQPDGAWSTGDENVDDTVDTAFTLLFLSRGRHPVLMNKLRFDGFWANRPRDLANLSRYTSHELERPINWQVVSAASDWTDWTDAPILYLASHEVPQLDPGDFDKLKLFAENGGLIFTHSDGDSESFNRFIEDLSQRLFPAYPLQDLPPDHDIYTTLFNIQPRPKLRGVSNGSRLLLLHSPTDLSKAWQARDYKAHPVPFQMGLNTFIYAAGKTNLRNKLHTSYVPESKIAPIATIPIARLRYGGNWNPEPAGWTRFCRLFQNQTSIQLSPLPIDLADLLPTTAPIAHLTGTNEIRFNSEQLTAIRNYVAFGGVLLIDTCGGSAAFAQSIRADALPRAFPNAKLKTLPSTHPIFVGADEAMTKVTPRLRPHTAESLASPTAPLEYFQEGKGTVIFTGQDLSTAMLGTNTYTVNGYDPDAAEAMIRNIVLWNLETPRY